MLVRCVIQISSVWPLRLLQHRMRSRDLLPSLYKTNTCIIIKLIKRLVQAPLSLLLEIVCIYNTNPKTLLTVLCSYNENTTFPKRRSARTIFVHSLVFRNIKLLLDGRTDWFQILLGVTDHDGECLHVTEFLWNSVPQALKVLMFFLWMNHELLNKKSNVNDSQICSVINFVLRSQHNTLLWFKM